MRTVLTIRARPDDRTSEEIIPWWTFVQVLARSDDLYTPPLVPAYMMSGRNGSIASVTTIRISFMPAMRFVHVSPPSSDSKTPIVVAANSRVTGRGASPGTGACLGRLGADGCEREGARPAGKEPVLAGSGRAGATVPGAGGCHGEGARLGAPGVGGCQCRADRTRSGSRLT